MADDFGLHAFLSQPDNALFEKQPQNTPVYEKQVYNDKEDEDDDSSAGPLSENADIAVGVELADIGVQKEVANEAIEKIVTHVTQQLMARKESITDEATMRLALVGILGESLANEIYPA